MDKVSLVPTYKLNDGNELPIIAYGTGSKLKGTDVTEYVESALEAGFTHVDTAAYYQTEPYVANAIRNVGLHRSELYITTKFSYGDVQSGIHKSLQNLNIKSVDLYLIHNPAVVKDLGKTWVEFEKIKKDGLSKSIGVSNFKPEHFDEIMSKANIVPAVNQIKLHPYNLSEQASTLEYCANHGIVVEAYSSLAPITSYPGGPLDPVLAKLADRIGGTPAQVIFKWVIAKGAVVVTTSTRRSRLDEYLATTSLPDLTADEITEIDAAGAQGPPSALRRQVSRIGAVVAGRVGAATPCACALLMMLLFLSLNLLVFYKAMMLWWEVLF